MPIAVRNAALRRGIFFAFFILTLSLLSACSLEGSGSKQTKVSAPGTEQVAMTPAAPTAMDTFRTLAPAEGMKFTQLFATPISNTDDRIKRVEDAVQSLRNDFDTVVPSMVRLVALEKDMKDLVRQLQSLTNSPPQDMGDAQGAVDALPVDPLQQTETVTPQPVEIPGEDVVRGTEPAQKEAGMTTNKSSSVTPEAAPAGNKPPAGAASPNFMLDPPPAAAAQPAAPAPQPEVIPAPPAPAAKAVQPAPAAPPAALPPATPSAPAAATPPVKARAGITPAPMSGVQVMDARIGDHPDKTRLVLDMTGAPDYSVSFAEGGKQLVIDLHGASWTGAKEWEAGSKYRLITSYRYEDGKLYVDMVYPATISNQQVLNTDGGAKLVIDLFSAQIHVK